MQEARQTVVLSGNNSWGNTQVIDWLKKQNVNNKCVWVSQPPPTQNDAEFTYLPHNKIQTILGQEFDVVIYNAHNGFFPDAFGAVTGTIRSGGLLLLLLPNFSGLNSLFMQRLARIIQADLSVQIITPKNNDKIAQFWSPSTLQSSKNKTTDDQLLAIAAIERVAKGRRRRPLVITADRGRGKSSVLGLSARHLLSSGLSNILITAPAKKSVEIAFKHAGDIAGLTFIAPDELVRTLAKTDLLLIDEAAAIPAPLLTKLLKHYARIVFSTTQHGYEGTGRGFDIRFRKALNQHTPNWKSLRLETPIRWMKNDPLEQFVFNALLLNTEQPAKHTGSNLDACSISKINRANLFKNEALLSQLFGLLVTAHYQTKPSDLQYLLDNDAVSIYIITSDNQILATALTATEGGFDDTLAQQIYAGKRRPKGHLIPQSLAFHSGLKVAAMLTGERIIRIAVHADCQRQGLATQLIRSIQQNSEDKDYLGVSFAATADMLQFWSKQSFSSVRIGLTRDASSGAHSVIQLLPFSLQGQTVFKQLRKQFQQSLPHLLSEPLSKLEAEIAEPLLKNKHQPLFSLENWQWREVTTYPNSNRGYEVCMASLWCWLEQLVQTAHFSKIDSTSKAILISKILQKTTWPEFIIQFSLTGKKEALQKFRAAVSNGIEHTHFTLKDAE